MSEQISFILDGDPASADVDGDTTLVDALRDQCSKTGTHVGCRNGDCGTCTVLIDDAPYKSCLILAYTAAGRTVETIQGLSDADGLHPVQQAFVDAEGFQCGYCLAGPVLCTVALLRYDPSPTTQAVEEALAGNLCRCTGYHNIAAAARKACGLNNQGASP